jgi:hypothetical protein
MLILGPGGTGKTTLVAHTLSKTNVIFASFTNKAAQNLQRVLTHARSTAQSTTIHKLLGLESAVEDVGGQIQLSFKFKYSRVDYLREYQALVFDELSMISSQLQDYIDNTIAYLRTKHNVTLQCVYLGDYYQLPPVGEKVAKIFEIAKEEKYPCVILSKQMRARTPVLSGIFEKLYAWCKYIANNGDMFMRSYPSVLASPSYSDQKKFVSAYMNGISTDENSVILTHSRKSCASYNVACQTLQDEKCQRDSRDFEDVDITFYPGDRCLLDRPVLLHNLERMSNGDYLVGLPTNDTLYNGEIFIVEQVEPIRIRTSLNTLDYLQAPFGAQLLTLRMLGTQNIARCPHIPASTQRRAFAKVKAMEKRKTYLDYVTCFTNQIGVFNYGYALTVYKSQGSEWRNVYVDLRNIFWSLRADESAAKLVFSSTYTAMTRASNSLTLYY